MYNSVNSYKSHVYSEFRRFVGGVPEEVGPYCPMLFHLSFYGFRLELQALVESVGTRC